MKFVNKPSPPRRCCKLCVQAEGPANSLLIASERLGHLLVPQLQSQPRTARLLDSKGLFENYMRHHKEKIEVMDRVTSAIGQASRLDLLKIKWQQLGLPLDQFPQITTRTPSSFCRSRKY